MEIFQKSPGRLYIAARRLILFWVFYGFPGGTAWRWSPVSPGDASL